MSLRIQRAKMKNEESDYLVDITGLTCPMPLIKARKTIKNATKGQIIKFIGTGDEEVSRKEILIAISNLKQQLLEDFNNQEDDRWHILIRKE